MGKKLISTILALTCALLCVFSLAACGNDDNPQTVAVTGITINKTELTLEVGGEETLSVTVTPDDATDKSVAWSSDKPEIASVNNDGKVTAKAAGTAVITATAGEKSATCTVKVNVPKPVKMTETQWKAAIDNTLNAKNYTWKWKADYGFGMVEIEISYDFEHRAIRLKNAAFVDEMEGYDNIIYEQSDGNFVIYYRDSEAAAWNKKAFPSDNCYGSTFSEIFSSLKFFSSEGVYIGFVRDLYDCVVYDDANDVYIVTLATEIDKEEEYGFSMPAGMKYVFTFQNGYASTMSMYFDGDEEGTTFFYFDFGTTTVPLP